MLTTATHDTKRGEDTRARLAALSEYAEEWARQLPMWTRILRGPPGPAAAELRPDRNDEYLLYQLLAGTWPCELLQLETPEDERLRGYAERIRQTMLKSMREARVHTGWAFPNAEYEEAMMAMIDAALTGGRASAFFAAFLPFMRRLAATGAHNSLIQTVLKLTVPGVPDLYNGTELWDLSMVDPDNRRPWTTRCAGACWSTSRRRWRPIGAPACEQLWQDWGDGRIKLATIMTLLRHRRACPELYARGDYQPLPALGPRADELCAYARTGDQQVLLVAVARCSRRREQQDFDADTLLAVPEALRRRQWHELLSGRSLLLQAEHFRATDLFSDLPAAVLAADAAGAA
jgi:(1->4)-alpha-D-glucan 1-alpha-D-glucosylmutase